jgi:hypothetical protein
VVVGLVGRDSIGGRNLRMELWWKNGSAQVCSEDYYVSTPLPFQELYLPVRLAVLQHLVVPYLTHILLTLSISKANIVTHFKHCVLNRMSMGFEWCDV